MSAQCGNSRDFPTTQILREINFGKLKISKTAILIILVALNFDFCEIMQFLELQIFQNHILELPKVVLLTIFEALKYDFGKFQL